MHTLSLSFITICADRTCVLFIISSICYSCRRLAKAFSLMDARSSGVAVFEGEGWRTRG